MSKPHPSRVRAPHAKSWLAASTLFTALALAACAGTGDLVPSDAAQTIYRNGTILSVDADNTVLEAIGVRDGKIIAAGTDAEVSAHSGPDTEVVDLQGRTMAPGFYDGHSHFVWAGTWTAFEIDLNSPPIGSVTSIDDIIARLRRNASGWVRRPGSLGSGMTIP